MQRSFFKRCHNRLTAAALLLALVQAMIPAGFMPASDGSFSLQVCHSGLPEHAGSPAGPAGHSGGHLQVDCPFGALPGAGPIVELALFHPPGRVATPLAVAHGQRPPVFRPERANPPRGPPALA
jgi:hypothetical protein